MNKMKKNRIRSPRRPTPPPSTSSPALTTVLNDLEDAMLYSCLSNEKDDLGRPVEEGRLKTHIALSPNGSFASLDDSSSSSSSSSDSDISLDRSSRPRPAATRRTRRSDQPRQHQHAEDNDGDCTSISAVSSVASLFFGQDGPCSLHLEDTTTNNEGSIRDAPSTTSTTTNSTASGRSAQRPNTHIRNTNNTLAVAPQPPLLKKSSLKASSPSASSSSATTPTNAPLKDKNINTTTTTPNTKNKVQFAQVNVREYNVSLSQNPSCSEGPPVELGWQFREPPPKCVQEYEKERQPLRRRSLHDLVLSDTVRRKMLLQTYTPQEITEAIRQVEHLKRQRVMTYMMLPAQAIDEAAEELYDYMSQVFN